MSHALRTLRCNPLFVLVQASLASMFAVSLAHAAITNCTVNSNVDDPSTASGAVTTLTASGTLRDCILAANLLTGSIGRPTAAGLTITFDAALSGATITLGSDLPLLFNNTRIDASALASPVIIEGGNAHRIFFVSGLPPIPVSGKPDPDDAQPIAVTLTNLTLQHALAQGGDAAAGGGGMGAGAALFVNKSAAVTINGVSFVGNAAQGGGGSGPGGHGGGGGMGAGIASFRGGGGLSGTSLSDGGAGIGTGGTALGAAGGWGGQDLGQLSSVQGFDPVNFDVDSGSGTSGLGLIGGGGAGANGRGGGFGGGATIDGSGGFGGGGGAGIGTVTTGGNGGFSGGGGSGFSGANAANGGFGGGGGNGPGVGGVGGASTAGGGAGFGGAVFVRAGGSLTVQSTGTTASMTMGSVAAGTALKNGAAAGTGMFLMSGGTTSFDIAGSYTIADALADDSTSTLPAAQSYTPGNGAGAAITKLGNGVLIFAGTNTYAGATMVNAGILRVAVPGKINASAVTVAAPGTLTGDGSTIAIDSFGTLAPGTPTDPQGTLSVNGSMRLESGALTCFHANGATTAVSDLNVTGLATINGMARIDFSGGPTVGTTYVLINAGSISGTFAGFETNMPNLDGSFSYTSTTVTFTVSASDVLFQNSFEQPVNDSPCIAAFTN